MGVQAEHERQAVLAAHAKAAEVASLLAFLSAAQQRWVRGTGSRNMVGVEGGSWERVGIRS